MPTLCTLREKLLEQPEQGVIIHHARNQPPQQKKYRNCQQDRQNGESILKEPEHTAQHFSCKRSHRTEKGCAIRAALAEGKLSQTRYDSYCAMYEEVKDVKDWQRRGM